MSFEDAKKALNQALISRFFTELTQIISGAAAAAIHSPKFHQGPKDICLLPKGQPGLTRAYRPFCVSSYTLGHVLEYDPRSVCFVGGAAIHAYGEILRPVFHRHFAEHLKTTDIDAVWWPKVQSLVVEKHAGLRRILSDLTDPPMVSDDSGFRPTPIDAFKNAKEFGVVSTSPYIQSLAHATVFEMHQLAQAFLIANNYELNNIVRAYLPPDYADETIRLETAYDNIRMPGVWNVHCTFHIRNNVSFKLLELAIHDGFSSQKSYTLEDMRMDPVYQTYPLRGGPEDWNIITVAMGSTTLNLPLLKQFLRQQWLALTNRVQFYWDRRDPSVFPKILSHYLRIYEIVNMHNQVKRMATAGIAVFERYAGYQYIPLLHFIEHFVRSKWFHIPEWLAACPWTAAECGMTAEDMETVKKLCLENKVLQSDVLCQPPQRDETTRVFTQRPRKTRKARQGVHP